MILNLILSVVVGGMLGHAIDAGYDGRLAQYITGPDSYAINLFSPEKIAQGKGGWQGEHAGKWLYAASKAYERTGDPALLGKLTSVADYLISRQEKDGYLGCYREDKRYYHRPSPDAMKVDWDTWIMAYLIKGFTETSVATGDPKYADCALRIVEFLHWTVFEQGIKIAQTGQHSGMAGCGILDPLCDLYALRPEPKVREMIERCIFELDDTPCLQLITLAGKGYDVALIGNGKIYEMLRCLTGMAKAYQLYADGSLPGGKSSSEPLLAACTNAWESICKWHLTTLGGPWGGINYCWELFNRPAEWAPYECTETCSVMQWLNFNWELLRISGDGKFASEIEKTAYNALMAARAEDGLRWEYYVRTNGELTPRGDWACCWSSGMVALEDLPCYVYDVRRDGLYVNVISEGVFEGKVRGKNVRVEQVSDYARTGVAEFTVIPNPTVNTNPAVIPSEAKESFTLAIHLPEWAPSFEASVNGKSVKASVKNGYIRIKRSWKAGDRLTLKFPYEIRTLEKAWEYRNAGKKEYNFSNWYNGFTKHYVTFSAGPLVFACDHADSFEKQNPLKLSREEIASARLENGATGASAPGTAGTSTTAGTSGTAGTSDTAASAPVMAPTPQLLAGPLALTPIALLPPFGDGPQWRTTWFQIQ